MPEVEALAALTALVGFDVTVDVDMLAYCRPQLSCKHSRHVKIIFFSLSDHITKVHVHVNTHKTFANDACVCARGVSESSPL